MGSINKLLTSSVGQKLVSGLTGLFLISFLVVHLSGNFLLFKGDNGDAFNAYSHFMSTNILIRTLEIGLVIGFLLHIYIGLKLHFQNKASRPKNYDKVSWQDNTNVFAKTMFWSGILIFVFLVIHLRSFFVLHRFGDPGTETMFDSVKIAFQDPVYSGFYVFAMILLGFHLNHGFQSAFQTFGLTGFKFGKTVKVLGTLFAIIVPLLFATMPLYFLFGGK